MSQFDSFVDDFATYIATGDDAALLPYLQETSNPEFLKVYRNGAIKASIDALTANFPVLKQQLGDHSFKLLCRNYILENWPTDTRLSTYGRGLSGYIKASAEAYTSQQIDFAQLDYAWLSSLLAGSNEQFTYESITSILNQGDADSLEQLQLSDSVQLIHLNQDSMHHWLNMKFTAESKMTDQNSKAILFWQQEKIVHYRSLNNFEDAFIYKLSESGSIFNAAETAINAQPNEDLSKLFATLLSSGILTCNSHKYKKNYENIN